MSKQHGSSDRRQPARGDIATFGTTAPAAHFRPQTTIVERVEVKVETEDADVDSDDDPDDGDCDSDKVPFRHSKIPGHRGGHPTFPTGSPVVNQPSGGQSILRDDIVKRAPITTGSSCTL